MCPYVAYVDSRAWQQIFKPWIQGIQPCFSKSKWNFSLEPMIPDGEKYFCVQFQLWPWTKGGKGYTFLCGFTRPGNATAALGSLRSLGQRMWLCLLDHLWTMHTGPKEKVSLPVILSAAQEDSLKRQGALHGTVGCQIPKGWADNSQPERPWSSKWGPQPSPRSTVSFKHLPSPESQHAIHSIRGSKAISAVRFTSPSPFTSGTTRATHGRVSGQEDQVQEV